jgi:uncharacterized membrane protein YfcA
MTGYLLSILVGLSLGLIGGGGSILTIPILVYFFKMDPVIASTYSLFVIGLTSLTGAFNHYQRGNVNFRVAMLFGIPSLIAVFIMRKWIMPMVPQHLATIGSFELTKPVLLMTVFAVFMVLASFSMIRKRNQLDADAGINHQKLIWLAVMVGVITGFIGIGGGFLIIPTLILFAGLPMKKAVGTSLTIMTISSLIGVLGDISRHESINYSFLAMFSGFAITGILIGCYLTKYVKDHRLKPAFGWFILCIGVFVLFSAI